LIDPNTTAEEYATLELCPVLAVGAVPAATAGVLVYISVQMSVPPATASTASRRLTRAA
jgi:zinc transporter ZupT